MEQLDLFGGATATDAPAPAAAPASDQLALFRPSFLDLRAPKPRGRAAQPVALDPALHDGTLA